MARGCGATIPEWVNLFGGYASPLAPSPKRRGGMRELIYFHADFPIVKDEPEGELEYAVGVGFLKNVFEVCLYGFVFHGGVVGHVYGVYAFHNHQTDFTFAGGKKIATERIEGCHDAK